MTMPKGSGWFDDPYSRHLRRWFDGEDWTEHVQTHSGKVSTDPATRGSGWFDDPYGKHLRRWFDGNCWTEHAQAHNGEVTSDFASRPQRSTQTTEWTGLTDFQKEVEPRGNKLLEAEQKSANERQATTDSAVRRFLRKGRQAEAKTHVRESADHATRQESAEEVHARRLSVRLEASRAAKKRLVKEKGAGGKLAMREFSERQRLRQGPQEMRAHDPQSAGQGSLTEVRARVPLSPDDFETVCEEWLRAKGLDATRTAKGPDQGLDVTGPGLAAQCKMFSSGKVGGPDIQKLFGAATQAGKTNKIVFTYSEGFTPQAVDSAQQLGVELWRFDPDGQTFRREA